jgi:CHAT domain-containing protein
MFAIDVRTSCLTLLACGSAHEAYSQGDEPLGIVSALLCAGATSVIGTMWKVQVGTARVFTEVLDGKLNAGGHGSGGGGLVDLAVAVQETALRLKRRQEGGTNRPYHWAAYVLHGSWFMSRRGLASLSLASS